MVSGIRAQKYAAMDARSCAKALALRGVPFAYGPATRGVNAPIRLTGKIRGVDFHAEPLRQRATSPFEILDCRLALALDDLAVVLTKYDIVETVHMSMYRPPGGPLLRSGKHSQHEIGMAIDIGHFVRRDGTKLVVESDWHGDIGDDTCGDDGQPHPPTERAKTLRSILCKAADERMFNLYLTPNYNTRHKNHFHLEVTRSARWFIVH
jgi:hypothetical protein